MDNNFDDDFLKNKFPLCIATNSVVMSEAVERSLRCGMTNDQIVEAKLRINCPLKFTEAMKCELQYDLPEEKWKQVVVDDIVYLVSNLCRLKNINGKIIHLVDYFFRTYKNGKNVFVNPIKLAAEVFDEEDLPNDIKVKKYIIKVKCAAEIKEKLNKQLALSSYDIAVCTLNIDLPGEVWKPIPSFAERYSVSNLGRIRSDFNNKIITQFSDNKGYKKVKLYANGEKVTCQVHRLVAEAFIEKTKEDYELCRDQINHLDGIKYNNSVSNLEWCNNSENGQHAAKTGLRPATITHAMLEEAVNLYCRGFSIKEICNMLNNSYVSISDASLREAIFRKTHKWCDDIPIPSKHAC